MYLAWTATIPSRDVLRPLCDVFLRASTPMCCMCVFFDPHVLDVCVLRPLCAVCVCASTPMCCMCVFFDPYVLDVCVLRPLCAVCVCALVIVQTDRQDTDENYFRRRKSCVFYTGVLTHNKTYSQ